MKKMLKKYESLSKEINNKIHYIILNYKQRDISKITGISESYLSELIKGKKNFSIEKKIEIISSFANSVKK